MTASTLDRWIAPRLVGALVFSFAINLALLMPALFMLQVYDRVLVTRSVETLVMLAAIAALTLLVFGVLDAIRTRLLAHAGAALELAFGARLLEERIAARLGVAERDRPDGPRDLAAVRTLLSGPSIVALFDAPWALAYLLLIAAFDPRLGLLAAGCAAGLVALAVWNDRQVRRTLPALEDQARATARWADHAQEHAELVTALGMRAAVSRRWERLADRRHRDQLAAAVVPGALSSASRTGRQAVQVLMLGAGAWLVIHEGATPGVMIAATVLLGRALAPVELSISGWQSIAAGLAAWRRLARQLDAPAHQPAMALPTPAGRLQAQGIGLVDAASGRVLLQPSSLSVAPGQVVAIIGPSGGGKSTLLRLLAGVLPATSGIVRLDGADLRQYASDALGAALGYLPQDVQLFPGSVAENIARFSGASAQSILDAARAAGAHEMILQLPQGYDTPVRGGGGGLSGGQRQRIALARALFGEPSVLLLDEPDASLDADGEQALMAALQGARARNAAAIVVTQRRRLLSIADQVLVLAAGRFERHALRHDNDTEPSATVRPAKENAA